jgi:hypothetical protein
VQGAKIVEETNLRAAILNYAEHSTTVAASARQRDGLGIHDVKWSHGNFSTHIATAQANGKIILYDLNRAGIELARLHEHNRQVHKLAFNPHQGHLLLSASHDTTVRLWDLRDMRRDIMTCRSRDRYKGISGGIRDVQWSPTDAVEFAFGTDDGIIQRWDFLHNKGPKQKITAHDQRICTSIDWHPDGKHLLSAGVDQTVKIWDFSVDGRRQKPVSVLATPYPVYQARWRPPYWSDEYYEKGVYQCTQFATSYDRDHPVIHVWDTRRPHLPFREINKFATAPTDMLWHSRDTLWTVGREGVFQQNDVHFASKVVDRRNLQAVALSPTGEMAAFAQKRPRRRRSGLDYSSDDTYLGKKRSSPEKNSLRNSADDSLDDSFLSSSLKKHHGRTASNRSAKSFGSTPPSEAAPKVMFLTDSMAMKNDSPQPHQLAFRATLPGAFNAQVFAYLAQKYKTIALPDPPTLESFLRLEHVFEQNAGYAQRAAFYRLAESWKIVGRSIAVAARRRAKLHREHRRMHHGSPACVSPSSLGQQGQQIVSSPLAARDSQLTVPQHPAVHTGSENLRQPPRHGPQHPSSTGASSSNLPTPLARPLTIFSSSPKGSQHLPDPDHDEDIQLPPAVAGPHSSGNGGTSPIPRPYYRSQASAHPKFTAPQWCHSPNDLDERKAMIGSWRAPPRVPLSLEPTNARGISITIPPRLDRHNSDESFAMFSASTDSPRGTSMPSSYASGRSETQGMQSIPEQWKHGPIDTGPGNPRPPESGNTLDQHPLERKNPDVSLQTSSTDTSIGEQGSRASLPSVGVQQGSAREGTALSARNGSREQAFLDIMNLRRNNQLLRHDSSESEAFLSSKGETYASSIDYNNPDMEASGTIVPDLHEELASPRGQKAPPALQRSPEGTPPVLESAAEESLLLSDFLAMQVDAEQGSAFAVIGLLKSLLAFHTNTLSDAQTSSFLLLLLTPLLPQTQSLTESPDFDAAEVLAHYSETMAALGLTPTQVQTILSTQLTQVLSAGINPFQAEAILQTYHDQLHSLSLFNSAVSLRRLAYPTYPAVYEQALKETQLGLLCLSCKSPINHPKDKMRCETCKRAQAPCPICWGRYPAFEPIATKKKAKAKLRFSQNGGEHRRKRTSLISTSSLPATDIEEEEPSPSRPETPSPPKPCLWTWCPLCGHGGHTNCLSTWFSTSALSDGACATEGCLCDCVSGLRRDNKIKEMLAKKADDKSKKVVRKGDDWNVRESKAVSAVRGALPLGDAATIPIREPAQNLAPNAAISGSGVLPARREEGRRVRVVGPRDER